MEPSTHHRNKDVCTKLGAVTPETVTPGAAPVPHKKGAHVKSEDLLNIPPEQLTPQQQARALVKAVKSRKAKLANAILLAMDEDDMEAIGKSVVKRAKNGHHQTTKLLFDFLDKHADDEEDDKRGGGSGAPYAININVVAPTAPTIAIDGEVVEGGGGGVESKPVS